MVQKRVRSLEQGLEHSRVLPRGLAWAGPKLVSLLATMREPRMGHQWVLPRDRPWARYWVPLLVMLSAAPLAVKWALLMLAVKWALLMARMWALVTVVHWESRSAQRLV